MSGEQWELTWVRQSEQKTAHGTDGPWVQPKAARTVVPTAPERVGQTEPCWAPWWAERMDRPEAGSMEPH
jgi:hypothetical protein